ncbi:MAG: M50 family metallopeptidase [Candidatus Saccharimonadales bacterium]
MSVGLLILGIFLFIMLVVVHELGHFIVARRNGVGADEFGIFFPPRLFKKRVKSKKGDYDFTINLLPLGGFVRLHGESDSDTRPGTYGAASLKNKTKIMLAGVAMNLLAAFVILTALAWLGMPKLVNHQFTIKSDTSVAKNEVLVGFVEKNSPAARAGLKSDDQLKSFTPVNNQGKIIKAKNAKNLSAVTKSLAGQKVIVKYLRSGQLKTTTATLRTKKIVAASLKTKNPKGYIGIAPSDYKLQRSTWSAPIVAGGLMVQFTVLTFQGLGHALAGLGSIIAGLATGNHAARVAGQTTASAQVSGPVGIFEILKHGSLLGYQFILMIVAIISLSLAIMNVLPIPALDGGKVFVTLGARGLHRKLTEKAEAMIYGTGFAVLIALIILITIADVHKY